LNGYATGDAYQGLRESVERPRPDLSNDPLWSQTDEVLDNFEELAESFADCSIQTELTEGERYTHVPDYHTCERVVDYSGACEIRHDYTIEEIFALGAGGTFEACGEGCVLWTVGRSFPTGPCYQELTGTMRVLKPEAILSAQLEELWYEDYIAGLWIDGNNYWLFGILRYTLYVQGWRDTESTICCGADRNCNADNQRTQSLLPYDGRLREQRLPDRLARPRCQRLLSNRGREARPARPDPGRGSGRRHGAHPHPLRSFSSAGRRHLRGRSRLPGSGECHR
jgi:hypothetical protein